MSVHDRKPPAEETPRPDEIGLESQPPPEQFHRLDAEEVDGRWERTKGLPEEEDDNFPPSSDEALPDEGEEKLIEREFLGEGETLPDNE